MENKVQIFENEEFGTIHTIVIDGEPWFVAKDVAIALGYTNPRKAVIDHVNDEDKGVTNRDTLGGSQRVVIINESGLYSLILSSKLPSAKQFQKWITSDVLPNIRKYGAYITDKKLDEVMNDNEAAEKLFRDLKAEKMKNRKLEEEVEKLKFKGEFYDEVLQSSDLITMTAIAKDYGMSATRMNALLNAYGIQYKMRNGLWVLYREYQNMGLTKTVTYTTPSGRTVIATYWTHCGREFLYRYLKERDLLPKSERIQPYNENTEE